MKRARLARRILRAADQRTIELLPGKLRPNLARRWDGHRVAVLGHATGLRRQERRDIEVRRDAPSPPFWISLGGANAPVFLGDLVDAVLGQGAQRAKGIRKRLRRRQTAMSAAKFKRALARVFRAIASGEVPRRVPVVARE